MEKTVSCAFGTWLAGVAFLFAATTVEALPGDLDLSFGGFGSAGRIEATGENSQDGAIDALGRVVTVGTVGNSFHVQRRSGARFLTVENMTITFPGQQSSSARAVAIAPDGKIVVAGEVVLGDGEHFGIARLDPDLVLDPTFGGGDGLQTSESAGTGLALRDVAVQNNNKIVIVGDFGPSPDDRDIAVQRFTDGGSPDPAFDGNGEAIFSDASAAAVVLLADAVVTRGGSVPENDNQLLIAGSTEQHDSFVVLRLNTDGSPDSGFSDDGEALADFGEGNESATDAAVAANGKIAVVGTDLDTNRVLVARFLSDGLPDEDFDGDGLGITDIQPMGGSAESVVFQSDGKIVVGGRAGGTPDSFLLMRFASDGSLDDRFGDPTTPGIVVTPFGTTASAVNALALQADGMLVAVGGERAARYRWDGALDAGGIASMAFDQDQTRGEVTGLAVDGDGRLVTAGTVRVGTFNMAIARFAADYGDGLDLSFGTDDPKTGRTMLGLANQNEEVQALAIRADGKPVFAGRAYTTGPTQLMVGRLNTDGTPDAQCNSVGFASISFGFGNDEGRALALAPNDRVYVGGRVIGPEDFDYGVARFTPACTVDQFGTSNPTEYKLSFDIDGSDFLNGVVYQAGVDRPVLAGVSGEGIVLMRVVADNSGSGPDTTFGIDGFSTLDVGLNESIAGIAAQSDGKLIVAGTVDQNFFVTRLSADGTQDPGFGTAGIAFADFGGIDSASALTVRADNSIAVVGSSFSADTMETAFAVAQFTPNGMPDTGFGENGRTTIAFGGDGTDVAQAVTFVGADHLAVGGFTVAAGSRRVALAALETTMAQLAQCVGDCDGDGFVFVNELLTMVSIGLGTADVSTCEAGDVDGGGEVTVDEILTAVNNALNGCPL